MARRTSEGALGCAVVALAVAEGAVVPALLHLCAVAVSKLACVVSVGQLHAPSIVAAVKSVAHSYASTTIGSRASPGTTVVPTGSAVHSPTVSAAIAYVERRASEVEVVAMWVASVDAEVPITCVPIEWAIEIGSVHKCAVLPIEQDIAQVEVALGPIVTKEIAMVVDAHQIIEVDLIGGFILVVSEVELVCHLVGEKESLVASLLITHC